MSKLHVKTDFEIRGGICRYPSLLFKGMPCRQRQTERKIYSAKLFVVVVSSVPKNGKRSIKMSVEKACDILGKQTANQKHQRLKR